MKDIEKNKVGMLTYLKNQKSMIIIVALLVLGIILLLLPEKSAQTVSADDDDRLKKYTSELEAKIEELCSGVQGVSNVSVTVYFDSGFETVYAYDEESKSTSNGLNSEKKYVIVGSGNEESMVCISERMPNICGVAIVCKGGGNSLIQNELVNLISSAFGVAKNKIYVAEGKK